ncbi:MAG: DNA polymerase-4 [Crocinitomicaceae bacterium]
MGRQVLHVDCDCFFAAVEMRDQPQYRNVPLAIGGSTDRRGVISTCNYQAREFGVRSAMATAQALKLCPDLKLVAGNMEKYRTASQQVMDILRVYGLQFEQVSIDEAFLELPPASNAPLIAQQIRRQVETEVGITVSVGMAPNKFLAKIASDWHKPNGQFAVLPSDVESFVEALNVRKIPGVGPKSAEKLNNLGLHTCKHIKELPLEWLIKKFGKSGKMLHDRANGIDHRSLSTHYQRKSISIERTFSEDINQGADIALALDEIWPKFLTRVESVGLSLDKLAPFVKVKFSDFHVTTLANHQKKATVENYLALLNEASIRDKLAIRLIGLGGKLIEAPVANPQLPLPL